MSDSPSPTERIRRMAIEDAHLADQDVDTTALDRLDDMSEEEAVKAIDDFYQFMYDGLGT